MTEPQISSIFWDNEGDSLADLDAVPIEQLKARAANVLGAEIDTLTALANPTDGQLARLDRQLKAVEKLGVVIREKGERKQQLDDIRRHASMPGHCEYPAGSEPDTKSSFNVNLPQG